MKILKSDRQRKYSPAAPGQAPGNRRTTTRSLSPQIYWGKSNEVYYYHSKHGQRARKCAQPCTFTRNDVSTHNARPFANKHSHRASCNEIYGPAQPGSNASVKQATKRFVGSTKKTDVCRWERCCVESQRNYGPHYPAQHLTEITNLEHTSNTLDSDRSKQFKKSRPTAPAKRTNKHTFIFQELKDAKYVFIRRGPQAGNWQALYEGPYQVIKRESKKFVVQVRGRKETVTIDRLKPAYIITDDAIPGLPTTAGTNKGPAYATTDDPNTPGLSVTAGRNSQAEQFPVRIPARTTSGPGSSDGGQLRSPSEHRVTRAGRRVHFPERYGSNM